MLPKRGSGWLEASPHARPSVGNETRQQRELIALRKVGARAARYSIEMWTARRLAEQIRRHRSTDYHPGHAWKVFARLAPHVTPPGRFDEFAGQTSPFANYRQTELQMKTLTSSIVGLREYAGGYSAGELFSALTADRYNKFVDFAKYRLKSQGDSRWLKQSLKKIEPEELITQALLKLSLGETEPKLGRRLKARNRVSMDAFTTCVQGIISNDLHELMSKARNRYEQQRIDDEEPNANAIGLAALKENNSDLLSRWDILSVFFRKLFERIQEQPALLEAVEEWEQRVHEHEGIGNNGTNHYDAGRMRKLAREIIAKLAFRFAPTANNGKETIQVIHSDSSNGSSGGPFCDKEPERTEAAA